MKLMHKLRALFRREKLDAEMTEEMRQHLELRAQANRAAGMSPEEARYAAQRAFGGLEQIKERAREHRGVLWLEHFIRDLRYASRQLVKAPGFAVAAISVLALGIGLNSAMFNALHAFAFSHRPYRAPDRVVQLFTQNQTDPSAFRAFSYAAYRELRDRGEIFSGVLAQNFTMAGVGEPSGIRRAFSAIVSSNYFEVLGVPLARGRAFSAAESQPGADLPVVVASHLFWRKTGFKPYLVGSAVRINERLFTVIGITPENFTGTMMLLGPELYFPLGVFDTLDNDADTRPTGPGLVRPDAYNLFLVGRLAPGVTTAGAGAALQRVASDLARIYPAEHKEQNLMLGPVPRLGMSNAPSSEGVIETFGVLLMGLAIAVLLIVCLNLASMLIARGHARRKEFAIRLALGGGRNRIIRQLLTEGLLLAGLGGGGGMLLALWASKLLSGSLAAHLPVAIFLPSAFSATSLAATFSLAALAVLFFALGPALKLSRADVLTDLKSHASEDVQGRRRRWWPRHPLVVGQVGLTLALLIATGLFVRLARRAANFDSGYRADSTAIVEVDASLAGYDQARATELYRAIGERLAALPGVRSASIGAIAPFGSVTRDRPVQRAGIAAAPDRRPATAADGRAYSAQWNSVGAEYFSTLGLTILRGRAFALTETDSAGSPPVAMIDDVLARKLWPDGDALGQRIQWAEGDARSAPSGGMEIVGIVSATREDLGQKNPRGAIYVPFAQGFRSNVHFHLRSGIDTAVGALDLLEPVRREIRSIAPALPIFSVRTFSQQRAAAMQTWTLRLGATLFSLFGGFALLVAVVGIYGVNAYAVSRRVREIGIRLALGADPRRVRRLILGEGLAMAAAGVVLGLLLGAGLARVLGSVFADLAPFDPFLFFTAVSGLFATVALACFFPARRASKIDPMVALRSE